MGDRFVEFYDDWLQRVEEESAARAERQADMTREALDAYDRGEGWL